MHTHAQAISLRSRVITISITVFAFLAVVFGAATPALAHDQLVGTEVISGSDGKAQAVQLSFNNNLIELGAEFVIVDSAGTDVTEGLPEISGMDVRQSFPASLDPGVYNVSWHVVSSDGHPIEGIFGLDLAADGSGKIVDAATIEEDPRSENETAQSASPQSDASDAGLGTGAIIAISAGGILVLAGAIAAIVVGQRRRAQGMQ